MEEPAAGRLCSLEDVLLVAHARIAECMGPDPETLKSMMFLDLYKLRSASRKAFELSYYDVAWLRKFSWLCGCRGQSW